VRIWIRIAFFVIGLLLLCNAWGANSPAAKLAVVIDAGHTKKMPGARGVSGRYEVEYNDALVARIATTLAKAGFVPILTRKPDQEIKMEERADIANTYNALVMLSIHHDSVQLVHLEPFEKNGKKLYRTRKPIAGYSLFVSKKNRQFAKSSAAAGFLGEELNKIGRKPSLHHAEPIPGEGRELLDTRLGIYRYDDLVVLKKAEIPAVLLEAGVIVDQNDEAYVTQAGHQQAIAGAIVQSLKKFAALQGAGLR
jgi:N-acetylmuramoyl-L-alanine amidase